MVLVSWVSLALAAPGGAVWSAGDTLELEGLQVVSGSPSGVRIAAASASRVLVVDGTTGALETDAELDGGNVTQVQVADDGTLAVAWKGGVTVHQPGGREILRVGGYTGRVEDLALAPDGGHVAVATGDGLFLHEVPGGRLVWQSEAARSRVGFHPDGARLVAASEDDNVVLGREKGAELGRFGMSPADRFSWSGAVLWSRSEAEAPRPHGEDWGPLDPVGEALGGARESWAVGPSGHVAVGSCRLDPSSGERWCTGSEAVGVALGPAGSMWIGTTEGLEHWRGLPEGAAQAAGGAGGQAVALGVGPAGHVIEAGDDGLVTVRGPDGGPLWGAQPDCGAGGCVPLAVGVTTTEGWWLSSDGVAWTWNLEGGRPADSKPRSTGATAGGRLDDGTWVLRVGDKARVGPKPGKGGGPSLPGAGLSVGPSAYATTGEVAWFDADGTPRPTLKLGPGRSARHVALAPDGSCLVLIDDQGAVHRYGADGRPVYRRPAGLGTVVDLVVLDDGTVVIAEPTSLRFLAPGDGADARRVVLAGEGPRALAGRSTAVVAWSDGASTAVWRIDPVPAVEPEPEPEPEPPPAATEAGDADPEEGEPAPAEE